MDLKDLLAEAGARPPSDADSRIDGLVPAIVLEPGDAEACARALELCHRERMSVVPVGGATRLELGNVPSRLDAYLKTTRLAGIEDHIPGDWTVAVGAGTTLAELQSALARSGQVLPIEVPNPERATIGGIFALGEPGFRRRPGVRPRDLLLGLEGVLADGTRVRAGGRVVKNVAGHDLMKLFVGSAGTLLVMTRAFLRLRAVPERVETLVLRFRRAGEVAPDWDGIRALPAPPEVVALLSPAAARRHGLDDWCLLLRFEGFREDVEGGVEAVRRIRGGDAVPSSLWESLRDFPLEGSLVLRGMAVPSRTFELAESWQDGGELVAYPDVGLVYTRCDEPDALADRKERAVVHGAGLVVERAPTEIKQSLDVYGDTPGGFELMKRIKEKLDPAGILSPGRFVGRL